MAVKQGLACPGEECVLCQVEAVSSQGRNWKNSGTWGVRKGKQGNRKRERRKIRRRRRRRRKRRRRGEGAGEGRGGGRPRGRDIFGLGGAIGMARHHCDTSGILALTKYSLHQLPPTEEQASADPGRGEGAQHRAEQLAEECLKVEGHLRASQEQPLLQNHSLVFVIARGVAFANMMQRAES